MPPLYDSIYYESEEMFLQCKLVCYSPGCGLSHFILVVKH